MPADGYRAVFFELSHSAKPRVPRNPERAAETAGQTQATHHALKVELRAVLRDGAAGGPSIVDASPRLVVRPRTVTTLMLVEEPWYAAGLTMIRSGALLWKNAKNPWALFMIESGLHDVMDAFAEEARRRATAGLAMIRSGASLWKRARNPWGLFMIDSGLQDILDAFAEEARRRAAAVATAGTAAGAASAPVEWPSMPMVRSRTSATLMLAEEPRVAGRTLQPVEIADHEKPTQLPPPSTPLSTGGGGVDREVEGGGQGWLCERKCPMMAAGASRPDIQEKSRNRQDRSRRGPGVDRSWMAPGFSWTFPGCRDGAPLRPCAGRPSTPEHPQRDARYPAAGRAPSTRALTTTCARAAGPAATLAPYAAGTIRTCACTIFTCVVRVAPPGPTSAERNVWV
jgi:hypothetical protein